VKGNGDIKKDNTGMSNIKRIQILSPIIKGFYLLLINLVKLLELLASGKR